MEQACIQKPLTWLSYCIAVLVKQYSQKNILIYFLAFLLCVATSPAAANGPMGIIFGMWVCPRAEALRDRAMRGVHLHIYYIYFGQ